MTSDLSQAILDRMSKIEQLLEEMNKKIDNFLGFEDLSEEELLEIRKLRKEMEKGDFVALEDLEK